MITENKPLTVYEKMSKNLMRGVLKNKVLKEQYTDENGQLAVNDIMEAVRVMYGFLETINTIQLAKVDEKYIAKVLDGMK